MKKISVIVPIYNTEKYLSECLESIVNQSYKNLEIILIDDGSTDKSPFICDEYSKQDSRIKVIHKKNEGVAVARNTGISIAQGDFLAFVDSDDILNLKMFEKLMNNLVNNDADISICDFSSILTDKDNPDCISNQIYSFDSHTALKHLYIDKDFCFVSFCGKIFPRNFFDNIIIPSFACAEDNYILYKLLYKAEKVVFDKSSLYIRRIRENSATQTFNESSSEDFRAFSEQMYFWEKENKMDLHKMCFVRCFKRLVMTMDCANSGKKIQGFDDIMKSAYEKCVKEHMKNVKIGPIEKKLFLTDWFDGKKHPFAYNYIRIKDYLRNYSFMKKHSLR